MDNLIAAAWASKKLSVMETGSSSLCLDLRRINEDLAKACQDVDFVVLEVLNNTLIYNL
jgi:hypothetical protein